MEFLVPLFWDRPINIILYHYIILYNHHFIAEVCWCIFNFSMFFHGSSWFCHHPSPISMVFSMLVPPKPGDPPGPWSPHVSAPWAGPSSASVAPGGSPTCSPQNGWVFQGKIPWKWVTNLSRNLHHMFVQNLWFPKNTSRNCALCSLAWKRSHCDSKAKFKTGWWHV